MQLEINAGYANSYGGVFVFLTVKKKKIDCFIFGHVYPFILVDYLLSVVLPVQLEGEQHLILYHFKSLN